MATTFGADTQAAAAVAGDLSRIGADLTATGWATDGAEAATGSPAVAQALRDFFSGSSDSREHMRQLVERAAGLLNMLVEGVHQLDQDLVSAIDAGGER